MVCARAISSHGFGSALTKSTTVFGTESGLLGNVSFSLIQSALPRQSAFFNYELRKPSRASEHERLRLGLHRWWFHRVREGTTDVTDDTNVWRMKRGENHDAEILSVMIRLIRGSPHFFFFDSINLRELRVLRGCLTWDLELGIWDLGFAKRVPAE